MQEVINFLINPGTQTGPAGTVDKADISWMIRHSIVYLGPTILLAFGEVLRQLSTIGSLSDFDWKLVLIILVGGVSSLFTDYYLKLKKNNTI